MSCLTATNTLVGAASERYAITGDPAGYFDARNSQYNIVVDRKGTATPDDDTFTYDYPDAVSATRMSFSNFTIANTPLGVVRTANGTDGAGRTGTLDLYEISNVLGGGLDYVQLGRITGTVAPIRQGASYFAVGQQHLASNLPTTGTARFSGGTRGTYVDDTGAALSTASDISMTVNFGTLSLTGSTSSFRATNASGASVTLPSGLDFAFTANIYTDPSRASSAFSGTATNATMTGVVQGNFYGPPTGAPVEAGLAYSLKPVGGSSTGSGLYGVGGLKRD